MESNTGFNNKKMNNKLKLNNIKLAFSYLKLANLSTVKYIREWGMDKYSQALYVKIVR